MQKKFILVLIVLIGLTVIFSIGVAVAQPLLPSKPPQGLITRLVEIKYTSELYLNTALKKTENTAAEKDSVLAIYNTLRWKLDGFVYQLSADMIAANSPRKIRLLNAWCLTQSNTININSNYPKPISTYVQAFNEIDALYRKEVLAQFENKSKTINLTTNVFYLFKDSYTIIKGLTDLKTQKTMAIIELLDHTNYLG